MSSNAARSSVSRSTDGYEIYQVMVLPSQVYRETGIALEPPGFPAALGIFKRVTRDMVGSKAFEQLKNIERDFVLAANKRHSQKQDLSHYTYKHARICRDAQKNWTIEYLFESLWLKYNAFKRPEKNQGQPFTTSALLQRQEQLLTAEKIAAVVIVVGILMIGYCLRP